MNKVHPNSFAFFIKGQPLSVNIITTQHFR
jgi:hypothetical protein